MDYDRLVYDLYGDKVPEQCTQDRIRDAIAVLTSREQFVLEKYYSSKFTYNKLGAEIPRADGKGMGVTGQRASQIIEKVLRELRAFIHNPYNPLHVLWARKIKEVMRSRLTLGQVLR